MAIWNFGKEQGFLELILDYGAQRARLYDLDASGPQGLEPIVNQSINTNIENSVIYYTILQTFRHHKVAMKGVLLL